MFFKRLSADKAEDLSLATKFMCASPGYKLQTFGRLPSDSEGRALLCGFPPECAPQDRLVFAAQEKSGAVLGLVQIARAHPLPHQAHIGLLLVCQGQRRRHLGCQMMEHLSRQARRWEGITHWQLSLLDSNSEGLHFWRHCGFHTVAQGCRSAELVDSGCIMERAVKTKPLCQSHRPPERSEELMARGLLAVLR
nr:GNAT family N-acetyltransferase [uncultured Roseateles sp.]